MPKSNITTVMTPKEMDEGILVQVTVDDLYKYLLESPAEIALQNDYLGWTEILEWASKNVSTGKLERQFIFIEVVRKPTI